MNPSKHLLNAETQVSVELANLASRFVRSKKGRLPASVKILAKAQELAAVAQMLHSDEPLRTQPIPSLVHPLAAARSGEPGFPLSDNLGRTMVDIAETQRAFGVDKPLAKPTPPEEDVPF